MTTSVSTYEYREGKAHTACGCGADLRETGEFIVRTHRFKVAGTLHAPAFYYYCVPCGLDAHADDEAGQAQRIAAWVQGVADSITATDAACLLESIRRVAVPDAEEDVIRTAVLAALVEHRLSETELRDLVDVCDRVLAKTRAVRLCAAQELEARR